MTDHVTAPAAETQAQPNGAAAARTARMRRYLFWAAAAVAFVAAAIAALAPQAAGPSGLILLSGIAAAGLLLLYALAAGDAAQRWLSPPSDTGEIMLRDHAVAASAFEALPDPALIMDRSGSPKRANAAYRAIAARAGVSAMSGGPPSLDRVLGAHPGVSSAVFRLSRVARRGEAGREILLAQPLEDGASRGYDIEIAPLPGGESLWRVREIGGDEAEVAPLSADALLNDAPIGFFSAAPDGAILHMNQTLKDWLGAPGDVTGMKVKDFVPEQAAAVLGRGRRPGGGPVRVNVEMTCRDGITSNASIVTTWPTPAEGGKPASRSVVFDRGGLGAPVGVAQALAEPILGDAAATMDEMFARAPFGVARLDGVDPVAALIRDANSALIDMTGSTPNQTRFAELFDLSDDATREAFENAENGSEAAIELPLAGAEAARKGEERFARVFFASERGGRRTAYVIEITNERSYRRQFLQSQKMEAIGKLAAEIAHNMNNILLAINLNTDLLLERHPVGDPAFPFLNEISASVSNGAGLARSLLAFSRQQTIQPEVTDLAEAISDYFITVRSLVGSSVRANVQHGRDLPLVKVDRGQLMQAVINLANNARDAMAPEGGELTISTRTASAEEVRELGMPDVAEVDFAVIEVADTGRGMDEATRARIFEPFFTTKDPGKGTGLGLSTVFGIVKQSGGYVHVVSQVGAGTTFQLYLPGYAATAEEREAATKQRQPVARKPVDLSGVGRILLVEDDDAARRASVMTLKRRGYEVVESCNGEEALEILEREADSIDLLLSDVSMPGMDGPTLLKAARPLLGGIPVVLMSGFAREDLAELLAGEPNVSFLSKPFKVEALAALMKSEINAD